MAAGASCLHGWERLTKRRLLRATPVRIPVLSSSARLAVDVLSGVSHLFFCFPLVLILEGRLYLSLLLFLDVTDTFLSFQILEVCKKRVFSDSCREAPRLFFIHMRTQPERAAIGLCHA